MKIVCAYCGKDMGEKDGNGVQGISHGMCKECSDAAWQELKQDRPAHEPTDTADAE